MKAVKALGKAFRRKDTAPKKQASTTSSEETWDACHSIPTDQFQAPINVLPSDVLLEIFSYAHGDNDGDATVYCYVECSRVCVTWRQLALDTPSLWARVNLSSTLWMRRSLRRAKSSLLVVEADIQRGQDIDLEVRLVDVLEGHAEQIKALSVLLPEQPTQRLERALAGGFPRLIALRLRTDAKRDLPLLGAEASGYPRLQSLMLNSPLPNILGMTGAQLTTLDLTVGSPDAALLRLLAPLTRLVTVKITLRRQFWTPDITDVPPSQTVLPALRFLFVTDFSDEDIAIRTGTLLSALSLPALERCTVNLFRVPIKTQHLHEFIATTLQRHFAYANQRTRLRLQRETSIAPVRCQPPGQTREHVDLTFQFTADDGAARELTLAWHVDGMGSASAARVIAAIGSVRDLPVPLVALKTALESVDTLILSGWTPGEADRDHWRTLLVSWASPLTNLCTLVLGTCAGAQTWRALLGNRDVVVRELDDDVIRFRKPAGYEELDSMFGVGEWDRHGVEGFHRYMTRSIGWDD
ncbi:hypothetical protein MIND_00578900 [Mycena indigotica]|uniref:F-box domain-containing protein n=1 Tax=Mycena indigotica TaxID=2126181 RepID=A0A8H6SQC7_9AGAR|nr:uncharacterized protein MIND_00578900 [Mycena indigotica]KAF7303499.1 hypothetical protein MIND_00578900 [Mycena indigotica]